MFVVGRVLDPQGKPVPNATVAISLRRKLLFAGPDSEGAFPAPAGHGASDASGRFRLDAARTSSAHHAEFGAIALAPGYGIGWADLDPGEDQPAAEIRLVPEQVIEGRLFDVQGQPVPARWSRSTAIRRHSHRSYSRQAVEDRWEGPHRWWGRVYDLPGWPKPATTDADGRFILHGIGRGLYAKLSVLDPRFAPQTIEVATDAPAGVKTLKAALLPARTVTGRVTYADSGRPAVMPGCTPVRAGRQGGYRYLTIETDADGRFRVSVAAGDRPMPRSVLLRVSRTLASGKTSHGPRGRPSRSSTWHCPAGCSSVARSPRRTPVGPWRTPWSSSPRPPREPPPPGGADGP